MKIFKSAALCLAALGLTACDQLVDAQMADINDQVTEDVMAQYDIAKRQGDPIQICVQAGLVSAAFLQAQDEANYQTWKSIEKMDCAAAGMPQ